jgi:hypothetical protein
MFDIFNILEEHRERFMEGFHGKIIMQLLTGH